MEGTRTMKGIFCLLWKEGSILDSDHEMASQVIRWNKAENMNPLTIFYIIKVVTSIYFVLPDVMQ